MDVTYREGGVLTSLNLRGVGPAETLTFDPGSRLSLITGDNGFGKTFLLECVWWALTGVWPGLPAHPNTPDAAISYAVTNGHTPDEAVAIRYDWDQQQWPERSTSGASAGLMVYARADNTYAVWDPARLTGTPVPEEIVFTTTELWDGKRVMSGGRSRFVSNGLIHDLVAWQNNPGRYPFAVFETVLARLSPSELGPLEPGDPTRLPHDSRDIPTIRLPYGNVPVVHAASGMRRIIALAYLIVWAWSEHTTQSELAHKVPQRQMAVMIDEVEAHLHPRWQRLIVPALLEVPQKLSDNLDVQFMITTHSPLVTASVEPLFDDSRDRLFVLEMAQSAIQLDDVPFVRRGAADSWLASDVFKMEYARSVEAEQAIEEAKQLQLEDHPNPDAVQRITQQLLSTLAEDDRFWPRWVWFAQQHGVDL